MSSVTLKTVDGVGIITIDNPPVNALSRTIRVKLIELLDKIKHDSTIRAAILLGKGRFFCAGADIAEFRAGDFVNPDINDIASAFAELGKPTIAAISGPALGGGLELAMACQYRIADQSAKMGLPEVSLGVLPGGGGTQRLPRLIGAVDALEMILSGASISAAAAREKGLVDAVVSMSGRFEEEAIAFARQAVNSAAQNGSFTSLSRMNVNAADIPPNFFEHARAALSTHSRGSPAHSRIIDCVEAAVNLPFSKGLAFEQDQFLACNRSHEAVALQHLFFAEREASRVPGVPENTSFRDIKRVGILGAGTMGGGIAMAFLNAGFSVDVVELRKETLERGLDAIRKNYESAAKKGKLTLADVSERMSRLAGALEYSILGECDLVIEAVFENLEVKKTACASIGKICKPGAIIATNTSTLDVDVLAQASGRPGDFIGMHFFSPAHIMKLLEVVRGEHTAPDVLASVMNIAKRIGKVAVVSGVCWGFIGNRMLESYLREAETLLLEGATPQQIDQALESFGMAMGPLRMMDLAGVDVCAKVVLSRLDTLDKTIDPNYRVTSQKLAELGRLGQKSGVGYYRYEGRQYLPDPAAQEIFEQLAEQHGIRRRARIDDTEIVERCLYPLINEGWKILEEGIACRSGDIDVVFVHGFGFPRLRGGPMHIGMRMANHIHAQLLEYGRAGDDRYGYWTPSRSLAEMAQVKVERAAA